MPMKTDSPNKPSRCPNYVGAHLHLGGQCERLGIVYVGGRKYCRSCERVMLRHLRRYAVTKLTEEQAQ
jgi:hypothetical protein